MPGNLISVGTGCIIFNAVILFFQQFFINLQYHSGIAALLTSRIKKKLFYLFIFKFSPMVTTEIAQLSQECNAWRETLRSFRDEFGQLKNRLQELAGRQTNRDVLLEIEHLDNQFHIQLINIHDLKRAIKNHHRKLNSEMAETSGQLTDETTTDHENLYNDYQRLENTLQEVKQEFSDFADHIR